MGLHPRPPSALRSLRFLPFPCLPPSAFHTLRYSSLSTPPLPFPPGSPLRGMTQVPKAGSQPKVSSPSVGEPVKGEYIPFKWGIS